MARLFAEGDVANGLLSADAMVARDAILEDRPGCWRLLIGLPATISIGMDRYAAEVTHATRCTVTAVSSNVSGGVPLIYRHSRQRGWCAARAYRLSVGLAETYIDPDF